MKTLATEDFNNEWAKFSAKFAELGLAEHYDMEALKNEIAESPCTTNEEAGTAYKGALLIHINMTAALALRISKMICGTFTIDDNTLLKVCYLMHLSKRFAYSDQVEEWQEKKGIFFKFNEREGCLKDGVRSAIEAMNNGIHLSESEYEAITCLGDEDDSKKVYQSIITTVVRMANELAYTIERERYKKA